MIKTSSNTSAGAIHIQADREMFLCLVRRGTDLSRTAIVAIYHILCYYHSMVIMIPLGTSLEHKAAYEHTKEDGCRDTGPYEKEPVPLHPFRTDIPAGL